MGKFMCSFIFTVILLAGPFSASSISAIDETVPSLILGAKIYRDRCVLCHGSKAMGDGVLPLKIANYPKTNLLEPSKAKTRSEILSVNVQGGTREDVSPLMPPFGDELSWVALESVTDFIMLVRSDYPQALKISNAIPSVSKVSVRSGQQIFSTRCVLCHGKYGEGNGRMSKLLKSPPPADLTASRAADAYLTKIISEGGEGVSRSKHMPPWKDQLSEAEITDVIEYLKKIRD